MNPAVRNSIERKHLSKRHRIRSIPLNPKYEEFLMDPESSKTFGFPDNSYLIDPNASWIDM